VSPLQPISQTANVEMLERFCLSILASVGASAESAEACTRSMMHASLHGVDSHGVRLLPHYVMGFKGGRLNRSPVLRFTRTRAASGLVDGDHAQGALATYRAANEAVSLAADAGMGAVGIYNSSHFGAAGAYAMSVAESGMIGLVLANSDAYVRLHEGAARFHGTNPIAMAVPVSDGPPWLLDMATSAIPLNRVKLFASQGKELPPAVASEADGRETREAHRVEMLAPVGADYGYKGAGLAGMAEVFAAVLTGGGLSHELLPMGGPDFSTPRNLGAFVVAIDPDAFAGAQAVARSMARYLDALRSSPPVQGGRVMAPGDREWEAAARRRNEGVPLDTETINAFAGLAKEFGLALPFGGSNQRHVGR
jgi:LDH2 family malate/lactate/ureidoglycolate dehydrogenase